MGQVFRWRSKPAHYAGVSSTMKYIFLSLMILLTGCSDSIDISVSPDLTHEEIVKLIKEVISLPVYEGDVFLPGYESRVSGNLTSLSYRSSKSQYPSSTHTNPIYPTIDVFIDTSRTDFVKITVEGQFVEEAKMLVIETIKKRANKRLNIDAQKARAS